MLGKLTKNIFFFMVVIISATSSYAQNNSLDDKIQSVLDTYLQTDGKSERASGVAVSISYPGQTDMISKSYFSGNTSHEVNGEKVTANTLFDIGSITKSYTSAIILQLEAEGRLDINDTLGKWLPQYPMWKAVKIKQLLNMTSGIPNYSEDPGFAEYIEHHLTDDIDDKFLLSFAHPDKPITPGKKYEYSNSNYILAGMIIERITRQSFTDALQTRILNPLNLNDTYYVAGPNWRSVSEMILPRKAHGYYYDFEKQKLYDFTNVNLSWGGAAGAIVSNTADQMKWVYALYHGTIFPERQRSKLLDELKSVVSMKTGQAISDVNENDPGAFGLGVGRSYEKNQRFWFYEGSTFAYRMLYIWNPCNKVTVVAVLNSKGGEGNQNSPISDKIKNLVMNVYQQIVESDSHLVCHGR